MKKNYLDATLDEYFEILDKENQKRSKLVAKSLVKYLKDSKDENKFDVIKEHITG